MTEAIFNKDHLNHYSIVRKPGTYVVKCSNTVRPEYIIEDGSKSRYIVNLRAATIESLEECLNILGTRQICSFHDVRDLFLSGTIWENDIDDLKRLPVKGEKVIVTFDYVDDIMRGISLSLIPREDLNTFDLNAYSQSRKLFKNLLNNI